MMQSASFFIKKQLIKIILNCINYSMNLSEIKLNKVARISRVDLHGKVLKRIVELGFCENSAVSVYAVSPKKKVYLVDIGGDLVALSKNVCDKIEVTNG